MQTTLRINDALYREAKAEAAREGTTLTRFLEEGIRLRLGQKQKEPFKVHRFRVYQAGKASMHLFRNLAKIAEEDLEKHELTKLGLRKAKR